MRVSGPAVGFTIIAATVLLNRDPPMIHIAFWADKHHKIRVFPASLAVQDWWAGSSRWSGDPLFIDGGELDWHLARYCQHLDTLFPGSHVVYGFEPAPEADRTPSLTVLEKDRQEYLDWCLQADEPVCLV